MYSQSPSSPRPLYQLKCPAPVMDSPNLGMQHNCTLTIEYAYELCTYTVCLVFRDPRKVSEHSSTDHILLLYPKDDHSRPPVMVRNRNWHNKSNDEDEFHFLVVIRLQNCIEVTHKSQSDSIGAIHLHYRNSFSFSLRATLMSPYNIPRMALTYFADSEWSRRLTFTYGTQS